MLESSNDLINVNCRHRKSQIENILNCEKGGLGGVIGKATDFVGLTDYSGQEAAQDNATYASAQASNTANAQLAFVKEMAQEQLAFSKEQYADWKSVYGDIQKNLGDYYENLSGDSMAAQQLSAQAREYADAYRKVNQQLAQRGISQSGVAAAQDVAMASQSANTRAGIRAGAEDMARTKQAGFLQLGLNSQASLLGNIGNASNSLISGTGSASNSLMQGYQYQSGQQYNTYGSIRDSNAATMSSLMGGLSKGGAFDSVTGAVGGGVSGVTSAVGGGVSSLMSMFSDVRLKNNIKLIGTRNGYNIYSWEWNDKAKSLGIDTEPNTGVLAQELLYTDAVHIDTDTGYYKVDYTKLGVI